MAALYTCDELVIKLKDIDTQLEDGTTRSKLDTGQTQNEFTQSLRQLERQYEKYLQMLSVQCPETYRDIVGPSVLKHGKGRC